MTHSERQDNIQSIGDIVKANRELVPKEILELNKLRSKLESDLKELDSRLIVLNRIQKALTIDELDPK